MKLKIQYLLILISAVVASLGTYPYAKDFSHTLFNNHTLSLFIASIFVPAAVSANIALGVYSINDTIAQSKRENRVHNLLIISICSISALATGFMCFVGYYTRLPFLANLFLSIMVVTVNIGIGFSAMNKALKDFSQISKSNKSKTVKMEPKGKSLRILISILIVLSALVVTLTAYLASAHGLRMLLGHTALNTDTVKHISYLTAILIWLPNATLFANGSRITILKIYDSISRKNFQFSYLSIFIIIIAVASGSAYAQMSLEFFDACKFIPGVFKNVARHYNFVFYGIMPLAFLISAVVNGYALENLRKETTKHYGHLFTHKS